MTTIAEMKELVQEWMAQPLDAVDLAVTYAEVKAELDKQLAFCMDQFVQVEKEIEWLKSERKESENK